MALTTAAPDCCGARPENGKNRGRSVGRRDIENSFETAAFAQLQAQAQGALTKTREDQAQRMVRVAKALDEVSETGQRMLLGRARDYFLELIAEARAALMEDAGAPPPDLNASLRCHLGGQVNHRRASSRFSSSPKPTEGFCAEQHTFGPWEPEGTPLCALNQRTCKTCGYTEHD